ncbi:hypothetical protein HD806DRAFT_494784 [Xylariaceae sp. AK1471]|nr:hypothetical protein HD806DRAFT_494784 [Xylariaceae sp. AK1471]
MTSQIIIGALQLAIATLQFIVTIFAWRGTRPFQLRIAQGNVEGRPLRELQPAAAAHELVQDNFNIN